MRPTGALHLGHYHGVLKNWVRLQNEYPCLFFVADWHALTTHYEAAGSGRGACLGHGDRLARRGNRPVARHAVYPVARAGARGAASAAVDDHAPGLAERVPTLQGPAGEADRPRPVDLWLSRLSAAAERRHPDLPRYAVPVGEDQVPHIEFTREIARRFNHIYGREPGFEEKAEGGGKEARQQESAKLYRELRTRYQEQGDDEALEAARKRCWTSSRTCRWGIVSGCSVISRAAAR